MVDINKIRNNTFQKEKLRQAKCRHKKQTILGRYILKSLEKNGFMLEYHWICPRCKLISTSRSNKGFEQIIVVDKW